MESDNFTVSLGSIVRESSVGEGEFNQALNEMGVENIIGALANQEQSVAPNDVGVLSRQVGDVTFSAYAYLSPPGYLQIWMEATDRPGERVNPMAIARFSWNWYQQTPEQAETHRRYVKCFHEAIG